MANLGANYTCADRLDKAVPLLEEAYKGSKEKLGPGHPTTLLSMKTLASAYGRVGRLGEALSLSTEVLQLNKEKLGPEHPDTLASMVSLGSFQVQRGEFAAAEPLLLEAYQGFVRRRAAGSAPFEEREFQAALVNLVQLYEKSNQPDKAKALVKEGRQFLSPDSPEFAGGLAQFSSVLLDVNEFADAEPMLRECLAIREKAEPDDWRTFNTQSMLGGACWDKPSSCRPPTRRLPRRSSQRPNRYWCRATKACSSARPRFRRG